jgi:hypothetical protein
LTAKTEYLQRDYKRRKTKHEPKPKLENQNNTFKFNLNSKPKGKTRESLIKRCWATSLVQVAEG